MSEFRRNHLSHLKDLQVLVGRDVRKEFHSLLGELGFNSNPPMRGEAYTSSHVEILWEVFLRALLLERTYQTTTDMPDNLVSDVIEYANDVTNLPKLLIKSYLQASFHVWTKKPFYFNVGYPSTELHAELEQFESETAAFITAHNPQGQRLDYATNEKRHELLLAEINLLNLKTIQGEGRDPNNEWDAERSFLILGISKVEAIKLGKKFEQNAIVWIERAKPSRLVLLQ